MDAELADRSGELIVVYGFTMYLNTPNPNTA